MTDLYFAHNSGIRFYTPESMFLGASIPPLTAFPQPNPDIDFQAIEANSRVDIRALLEAGKRSPELVLLFGAPASGKSTLCATYFKGYQWVNHSTVKPFTKCFETAAYWLKRRRSVVVDDTNSTREVFFAASVDCRCERDGSASLCSATYPCERWRWRVRGVWRPI